MAVLERAELHASPLADLHAILDRHSDAETGDIRRILAARS